MGLPTCSAACCRRAVNIRYDVSVNGSCSGISASNISFKLCNTNMHLCPADTVHSSLPELCTKITHSQLQHGPKHSINSLLCVFKHSLTFLCFFHNTPKDTNRPLPLTCSQSFINALVFVRYLCSSVCVCLIQCFHNTASLMPRGCI